MIQENEVTCFILENEVTVTTHTNSNEIIWMTIQHMPTNIIVSTYDVSEGYHRTKKRLMKELNEKVNS